MIGLAERWDRIESLLQDLPADPEPTGAGLSASGVKTSVGLLQGAAISTKSYMWVFSGGPPENPAVLYRYSPTRSGDIPLPAGPSSFATWKTGLFPLTIMPQKTPSDPLSSDARTGCLQVTLTERMLPLRSTASLKQQKHADSIPTDISGIFLKSCLLHIPRLT
jgi:hypothetical protein